MGKPTKQSMLDAIMPRTPAIDECLTTKAIPIPPDFHNVKLRNIVKVIKWYFAGISMALFFLLVEVLKEGIRKKISSIQLEKRKKRKRKMKRMAERKRILEHENNNLANYRMQKMEADQKRIPESEKTSPILSQRHLLGFE